MIFYACIKYLNANEILPKNYYTKPNCQKHLTKKQLLILNTVFPTYNTLINNDLAL